MKVIIESVVYLQNGFITDNSGQIVAITFPDKIFDNYECFTKGFQHNSFDDPVAAILNAVYEQRQKPKQLALKRAC